MTDIKIDSAASKATPIPVIKPPQPTQPAPPAASDTTASKQPLPQLTLQQRTEQLLEERYVRVDATTGTSSFFTHRGHCEKCGWQTMQHSESAAHDLVLQHAWQHWREVTAQAQAETTTTAVAVKGTT